MGLDRGRQKDAETKGTERGRWIKREKLCVSINVLFTPGITLQVSGSVRAVFTHYFLLYVSTLRAQSALWCLYHGPLRKEKQVAFKFSDVFGLFVVSSARL